MVLDISQDLPFWVTVEVFFLFFRVVMSCGQGGWTVAKGASAYSGTFVVGFDFSVRAEAPWCIMTVPGSKCSFFMYPQLSFCAYLSYNLPHLTEPVESSQNQPHNHFRSAKRDKRNIRSSLCERINPRSLAGKLFMLILHSRYYLHACSQMLSPVRLTRHTGMLQLSFKYTCGKHWIWQPGKCTWPNVFISFF